MTDIKNEDTGDKKSLNFIEQAVEKDLKEGKNGGKVQTMAVYVTFVSTTQTRPKRTWNT